MMLSRRSFLVAAAAAVGGGLGGCGSGEVRTPPGPFQLGIASGDPAPDGFVLQKPRQSWGFFSVAGR